MKDDLVLLPMPRRLTRGAGFAAPSARVVETIDPHVARPQGYRLEVRPDSVHLTAADPAGAFYARQTLAQLRRQFGDRLPILHIEDWPDLPARGVMIDISRDKVPTMQTLLGIVDELASMKVNQIQLYTEHTFAYRNHEVVWREASPMTHDEIRTLDAYCRERFIELVPNQNSFGHMERWLKHPQYKDLAECPDGATYWGDHRPAATLNPLDPRSIALVRELHRELLECFTSKLFNVGCDETMELGMGRSKAECERRGKERVYLDFLLKLHASCRENGRQMMFWGDIIMHKPELIPEIPKDVVALEWGYEAEHPFDDHGAKFRASGLPLYVCPGTSSWCSLLGRTDNALGNLASAARNGLKHGAIGYLNTDWGDYGHWQYWPVSWIPLAAGAAYAWCYESNQSLDVRAAADRFVFRDSAGIMGRVAYDLGNVYKAAGKMLPNNSILIRVLMNDPMVPEHLSGMTRENYDAAEAAIRSAIATIDQAKMDRPDAALVKREFKNNAEMAILACRLGRRRIDPESEDAPTINDQLRAIVAEHRNVWLSRNRPGGLKDSTARLERLAITEK
jgi:hexosaminidase